MDDATERERLVEQLRRRNHVERASTAAALRAVPRHEFVPDGSRRHAYEDRPLGIGAGQTISAPHMVAGMTDLLELEPGERVLEIGTGCGYHAAVTADVVGPGNVYSVEYDPSLADEARERLSRLGYEVHVRQGDGHAGWPEHAPYDAAYLTCAPAELPSAVVDQLRVGGRLVAPVGTDVQRLVRLVREADGTTRETHGRVRFVPMRSE